MFVVVVVYKWHELPQILAVVDNVRKMTEKKSLSMVNMDRLSTYCCCCCYLFVHCFLFCFVSSP